MITMLSCLFNVVVQIVFSSFAHKTPGPVSLYRNIARTHVDFVVTRRTLGGRKLWESKDDRKWGHDKFEELTMQERHHEEVSIFCIC